MTSVFDEGVEDELRSRGVRWITHFTNSRNLPRIIQSGAILSTAHLEGNNLPHERTDPERMDGKLDFICCNIEYPNMYYFDFASGRENTVNYSDWVVLLLDPAVAARRGALFSPRNAAKNFGAELQEGLAGLERQYTTAPGGWARTDTHWPASPNDVQAEVLIPDRIDLSEVVGIVVPNDESLRREVGRLRQIGLEPEAITWYTSEALFEKYQVAGAVRYSREMVLTERKIDREGV